MSDSRDARVTKSSFPNYPFIAGSSSEPRDRWLGYVTMEEAIEHCETTKMRRKKGNVALEIVFPNMKEIAMKRMYYNLAVSGSSGLSAFYYKVRSK